MASSESSQPIRVRFIDPQGKEHSDIFPDGLAGGGQLELDITLPREFSAGWSLEISVSVPLVDIHHVFVTPLLDGVGQKQWVHIPWIIRQPISTHCGLPLICGYSRHGDNGFFLGALDQVADAEVSFKVDYPHDQAQPRMGNGIFGYRRTWGDQPAEGPVRFLLSMEPLPWEEVVQDYAAWHDRSLGLKAPPLPAAALDPVWCSWYVQLERADQAGISRQLDSIAKTGIGTVIIDVGWSKTETVVFPDAAGDWEVNEKFPDFLGLIHEIQGKGMKAVLWVSPFVIGKRAKVRKSVEHLLGVLDGRQMNSLDPRLRETQAYLAKQAARLMKDHQLDGLKLDFIDPLIEAFGDQFDICSVRLDTLPGKDYTTLSVAKGTEACLRAMSEAIRGVKPDALIEYRQNYSNLATRPFATAFRSQDSPFDPDHIRHMVCLLRMTCPGASIHADPAIWNVAEGDLNVARFLASMCFYSVPFFSFDFAIQRESHLRLIERWLRFAGEHRQEIHEGRIRLLSDDPRMSSVANVSGQTAFVGLFAKDPPYRIEVGNWDVSELWIFNGTTRDRIFLDGTEIVAAEIEELDGTRRTGAAGKADSIDCPPGSLVHIILKARS